MMARKGRSSKASTAVDGAPLRAPKAIEADCRATTPHIPWALSCSLLALGAAVWHNRAWLTHIRASSGHSKEWRPPKGHMTAYRDAGGRCGIDEVPASALSRDMFDSQFLERKPLIIRGLTAERARSSEWERAAFEATFGALRGSVAVPLYTEQVGPASMLVEDRPEHVVTITRMLDSESELLFDRSNSTLGWRLFEQHGVPSDFLAWTTAAQRYHAPSAMDALPIASVGGPGAGLTMHYHGGTWLSLMVGHKLWFLLPPGGLDHVSEPEKEAAFRFRSPSEWDPAALAGGGVAPHVCEQRPGDVVYLPSLWVRQHGRSQTRTPCACCHARTSATKRRRRFALLRALYVSATAPRNPQ
jgi:hypothetical protein